LEKFLGESSDIACGWMGHYDGMTLEELEARARDKQITLPQAMMRDWLRLFQRLKPELAPLRPAP
jgi:hypothetical protein